MSDKLKSQPALNLDDSATFSADVNTPESGDSKPDSASLSDSPSNFADAPAQPDSSSLNSDTPNADVQPGISDTQEASGLPDSSLNELPDQTGTACTSDQADVSSAESASANTTTAASQTEKTEEAAPDGSSEESSDSSEAPLTLMDHFRELRTRLVKCFIIVIAGFCVCWFFRSYLVDFLYAPLLNALQATGQDPKTIATGVAENFFTIMKIAFVGSIFLGSPLIFYQIWAFIAPGLYDEEKIYIVPVAVASAVFFLLGASFCYFVVFPNALPFLLGFGENYMANTPKASEYYGFALQLLFAFGLIFEMPLFVFFLARLGIVTAKMLSRFRRYFIVIAFIVAAILTPPDVMSQLLMAAPMLLLYEFSIIIARIFGRDRKKKNKNGKPETQEEQPQEQSA